MTTRSVDNFSTINDVNDVQDYLLDPNCLFPSSALNNVPNGVNTGQYPIWENSSSSYTLSGFPSVRLGSFAGSTGQDNNAIAIGTNSGRHEQSTLAISIGWNAGRTHQGSSAIAIGSQAGSQTQGQNCISIGELSGQQNQQFESIAIGKCAGQNSQGTLSIAIGSYAGQSSQPNNSIIINATGNPLNPTLSNACFIDPVRNTTTGSTFLSYDPTSKELSYVNNLNLTNPLVIPSGSVNTCSIQFSGTPSTGIYSPSTNNFSIATNGTQRLSINSSGFTTIHTSQFSVPSGSASGPSYIFGSDGNSGFYRLSEDNVGISTNGTLRMNWATTAIVCNLPLQLQTTGGTPSNLDFYQEYTHNVGWNFGSTNSNVQVGNVRYVRIGRIVTMTITYDWTAALTMNDVGGGTAVMSTATLSVMRPSQTVSFLGFAQVNGTNTTVRVLQNTSGTTEITPLAGGNFAQNTTLRLWTNSFSYALT